MANGIGWIWGLGCVFGIKEAYLELGDIGKADLGVDLYWGVGLGMWVDLELGRKFGVDLGLKCGFESEEGGFGTRGADFQLGYEFGAEVRFEEVGFGLQGIKLDQNMWSWY